MINSHVQNSKVVIKQFSISDKDGRVLTLNLKNGLIRKTSPKNIGTKFGYYDDNAEQLLSSKFETPMGIIIKKLKDIEKIDRCVNFNEKEIEQISRFIIVLFLRSPQIVEGTNIKSIFANLLNIKITPSDIIKTIENTSIIEQFSKNHYPVVIFNENEVKFISSISGLIVYQNKSTSETCWFVPITPTIAIHYVGDEFFNNVYQNHTSVGISESDVKFYNEKLTESAIKRGDEVVFSASNDELIRLKSICLDNKLMH